MDIDIDHRIVIGIAIILGILLIYLFWIEIQRIRIVFEISKVNNI